MDKTYLFSIFGLFACTPVDESNTNQTKDEPVDSDGDGYTDDEEIEAGTNPDFSYSHPYEFGNYNIGYCERGIADPTGPTTETSTEYGSWPIHNRGDIVDNFTMVDHHGQMIDLYSFCGKHIMLVLGQEWCPPCEDLSHQVQGIQDTYGDRVQIIEILTADNNYNEPTQDVLQGWAESGGITTIPVLNGFNDAEALNVYERDGYIPTTVIIGPDMDVLNLDRGVTDAGRYLSDSE